MSSTIPLAGLLLPLAERLAPAPAAWDLARQLADLPFQGGAAGLFGYDLCHHLERLPRSRLDELPDAVLALLCPFRVIRRRADVV